MSIFGSFINEQSERETIELTDYEVKGIMEAREIAEAEEMESFSEEVVFERVILHSSEGKDLKARISQILKDNTAKLTTPDKIQSFFFGSTAINPEAVNKATKGIQELFDACHATKVSKDSGYNKAGYPNNTKVFTGIKGGKLYIVKVSFDKRSSNVVTFGFNEKSLDKFVVPEEAIKFALDNCKEEYIIEISKNSIRSIKIGKGGDSSEENVDLNNKLLNKFGDICRKNENMGSIVFKKQ